MLYLCSEISKPTAPARVRPDQSGLKIRPHRNYWAYLTNKRQKNVVPLQRNFKTTAPARVRRRPRLLRDARGTAQHTHPYHHESPNIAVKGATLLKEIAPHTKQQSSQTAKRSFSEAVFQQSGRTAKRSFSKAVKLYDK